jgi:hypothetical protein
VSGVLIVDIHKLSVILKVAWNARKMRARGCFTDCTQLRENLIILFPASRCRIRVGGRAEAANRCSECEKEA